jgi:hypothetical protein
VSPSDRRFRLSLTLLGVRYRVTLVVPAVEP